MDTANMVFGLRQLQDICQEQNKALYATFVDLFKAFDTLRKQGLWKVLKRHGFQLKSISMVIHVHDA